MGNRKGCGILGGNLCRLTEEGGLSLRYSLEVQCALHMKYTWTLLSTKNLWTNFFRAKYFKKGHRVMSFSNSSGSHFWKSIFEVLDNVRLRVKVGSGSFWHNRWVSSGPLTMHARSDINHWLSSGLIILEIQTI